MESFLILGAILAALGLASIALVKYLEKKQKAN